MAAMSRYATRYPPPVISGAHAIVYSTDPDADRVFLRDVLGLPHVDARLTEVTLPGSGTIGVYEPKHARPRAPGAR
jgi:hypothetical protein